MMRNHFTIRLLFFICASSIFSGIAVAELDLCPLHLRVSDGEGTNLPYRGYLANAQGRALYPRGTIHFEHLSSYPEQHFISDAPLELVLPPGNYTLRVERGPEWKPVEKSFDLHSTQPFVLDLQLERWIDMNALGWYSGDTHLHRNPTDLEVALLAEDLNFGANETLWNRNDAYKNNQLPVPALPFLNPGFPAHPHHALNVRAQETERLGDGWGAALFLGASEPVSLPKDPYYPLTAMVCEEARRKGAHVDFEKPVWKDTPVCAALGLVDSIGIIHNHFHPHAVLPMGVVKDAIIPPSSLEMSPREMARYTIQLYDHLLNCGLRIPVSAGTASGVMPSWPGYARTYVKLEVPFSPQVWLEQLRAGRSFATNGPILFLEAEGHLPGDVIQLEEASKPMQIKVEARSQFLRLELLELVHNGVVVASTNADAKDQRELRLALPLDLSPGWISARAFEAEGDTQVFAVTSPIYLQRGEDRGVVADSARYYRDIVQGTIDQARVEKRFKAGEEEQAALALLEKALAFYRERCSKTP